MAYSSITKPTDYFNTLTWVGSGNSSRDFTGVGFAPDLVWVKNRGGSVAINHSLYDRLRGAGANKELVPNNTTAEGAENHDSYDYLSAFGSDGFSSTYVGNVAYYFNESGANYVGWSWLANGGTGSSNSDGAITSTVSANTTAGFSIVKYTATGSATNFGHGLGVAPSVVIIKDIDGTSGSGWLVGHTGIGMTNYIKLNATQASTSSTDVFAQNATSSLVYIGNSAAVSESSKNYIAYCFAEKKGYSKFGSYTGNGGTDGTFIYTGFKPAWVIAKRTDSSSSGAWVMWDNTRSTFNPCDEYLVANANSAESTTGTPIDIFSNGWKPGSAGACNISGGSFIYLAFAENPFVGNDSGTAVPVTAR